METKFWGYGFPFSSTLVFGEISDLARRNSKSKFKMHCLGLVTYLSYHVYLELKIAPSASASGISAMATRSYVPRYGNGSNTGEMSRSHSSRGEEVSSPRVGCFWITRSPPSPPPLHALHIYVYFVAFATRL